MVSINLVVENLLKEVKENILSVCHLLKQKVCQLLKKESAVKRKRAKPQGVGGKPTMVKTFKSGGGQIKPRGCGIAKRGFGKAMKGK